MSDPGEKKPVVNVECPSCGSHLVVDAGQGTVLECRDRSNPRKEADLKNAEKLLSDEKARVEARYQEIVRSEKEKGASMEKRFKDFLEKAKDEPAPRPVRDIDLD